MYQPTVLEETAEQHEARLRTVGVWDELLRAKEQRKQEEAKTAEAS